MYQYVCVHTFTCNYMCIFSDETYIHNVNVFSVNKIKIDATLICFNRNKHLLFDRPNKLIVMRITLTTNNIITAA